MINKQHWFMCNNCPLTLTNNTRIVLVIHQHVTWKAGNRPEDNYRVSQKIYPNCVLACSLGNGCLSWVLRECTVHVLLYYCIECIPYTHEADRNLTAYNMLLYHGANVNNTQASTDGKWVLYIAHIYYHLRDRYYVSSWWIIITLAAINTSTYEINFTSAHGHKKQRPTLKYMWRLRWTP